MNERQSVIRVNGLFILAILNHIADKVSLSLIIIIPCDIPFEIVQVHEFNNWRY